MDVNNLLPQLQTMLQWVIIIGVGVGVMILLAVVFFLLARRGRSKKNRGVARPQLFLDIHSLGEHGPAPYSIRFEFYHTPVRLAAVVIAPVGRDRSTPTAAELQQLLEFIVPGLQDVVASHGTEVRAWPAQLSVQGFKQAFFNNVPLPGQRGQGSPWCSLAGKFAAHGRGYVAGLACRSADANSVGQVMVEHETQWMDILRIRL